MQYVLSSGKKNHVDLKTFIRAVCSMTTNDCTLHKVIIFTWVLSSGEKTHVNFTTPNAKSQKPAWFFSSGVKTHALIQHTLIVTDSKLNSLMV